MASPIVRAGIGLLEVLFFVGLVGSGLVFLLTMVEDTKTILSRSEGEHKEG